MAVPVTPGSSDLQGPKDFGFLRAEERAQNAKKSKKTLCEETPRYLPPTAALLIGFRQAQLLTNKRSLVFGLVGDRKIMKKKRFCGCGCHHFIFIAGAVCHVMCVCDEAVMSLHGMVPTTPNAFIYMLWLFFSRIFNFSFLLHALHSKYLIHKLSHQTYYNYTSLHLRIKNQKSESQ